MKTKTVLSIRELTLKTYIGFYPEERKNKQKVIINISFRINQPKSVKNDDVSHTVNYAALTEEVYNAVAKSKFNLLESLVDFIAKIIMKDKKIKWAEIEVIKPEAPLPNTKGSSVKLTVKR